MGYEIPIIIAYNTLLLVLGAAWVAGYLDGLQHTAQDFALGKAGENRASYGLKSEPSPPSPSLLSLFASSGSVVTGSMLLMVSCGVLDRYY